MAVDYNTNKKVIKKEVSYLGRDFSDIRQNLIFQTNTMILMNHLRV